MRFFRPSRRTPEDVTPPSVLGLPGVDLRIQALETALEALEGRFSEGLQQRLDASQYAHETRSTVNEHSTRFEELIFAVSEGISKVERAEARIRATVRRARAELEAGGTYSPALDAEAQELRVIDGGGGGEARVQPVPESVEQPDLTDLPGDWHPDDIKILMG